MTKTKYWLSLLAISVVLVAGSLAVSPIAFAGDDEDDEDDDGGPPGVLGFYRVESPGNVADPFNTSTALATCNIGDKVVGGGWIQVSGNGKDPNAVRSYPNTDSSWSAQVWHNQDTNTPLKIHAWAICADLTP